MKERDNLHFNFRTIDGYNKQINIVISAREAAKSTAFNLDKAYAAWKKDRITTLYLVRQIVEISDALILSIQDNILNKFTDDNVKFWYSKNAMRDGITDIYILTKHKEKRIEKDKDGKDVEIEYEAEQKELYMRILAVSISSRRIKQSLLKNVGFIVFDEFIVNGRNGEKYLKNETLKIAEIYTTYVREKSEGKQLKMYFLGNPYSLANPVFNWLGIDTNKLKFGECYVGKNFVVQWYALSEGLKAKILAENPLYEFDEFYRSYAFDGKPVLDKNIKIVTQLPQHYNLKFVFKINFQFIGIYQNNYWEDKEDRYYCQFISSSDFSKRRTAYCFDFDELMNRCALISRDDLIKFSKFKAAMRKRDVAFSCVDCYYLVEEIYFNL